jgi:DNA polymerase-3 subunit delta'
MPFRDVIGHRRLIGLLAGSVSRDSLPPSLIFAGPSGVGKRLTALATAQALNCTELVSAGGSLSKSSDRRSPALRGGGVPGQADSLEVDACGTCAACTRIARGVHADVIVIEPGDSGSIKTEAVRDVIDRAMYRPFEGRRRVVILDDADALVAPAQNALLKTLEEPPSSSTFILVTSRPDLLLPTVRSRCPRLRFRSLGAEDIAMALVARGQSEAEARTIAASADGSLEQALQMSAGDLTEVRTAAHQILAAAAQSDDPRRRIEGAKGLLASTPAAAGDREQLALHLRAMASLIRDIELLSAGGDVRALANADMRPAIERLTGAYRGERGLRAFSAIDQALLALERNAGAKIVADWLALQL